MMKKLIFILVGVFWAVTTLATGPLIPVVLNQQVPDRYATWDFVLSESGKSWFAYYGADNKLYVRRPDGNEISLGATDRLHQQSGLAMTPVGDALAVLWRDKLPQKNLYLLPKLNPTGEVPASIIVGGDESEPLPGLEIAHSEKGEYFLQWLGEKVDEKSDEKYHLYFRTLEPDGKTLSPVERVMSGMYPAWIVDQKVIPIFSWMEHEGQLAMTMRVFDRTDKKFGPLVKIADAPKISAIFKAIKSGERWFLVWLGKYGDQQELLLEGVYSDDKGQTWKRFAIEDLRGFNLGGFNIITDHSKNILIALDGNWRFTDPNNTKNNVYIVRSNDNGATWQKPQTVRPDEMKITKAQYPVLAWGAQPGTVMLAWEDWRDIRPNIYASYSRDYGVTWEPALPLGRPGVWSVGLDPQSQVLLLGQNGRFQLVAKQYDDDSLADRHSYVLYTFNWDELKENAVTLKTSDMRAQRATETRLRERATVYWQALQDKNYETAYALMDPFFRKKRDLKTYLSDKGMVQYHRYQIGAVAQQGNIAKVQVEIEASVPEFKTPTGRTVSQPQKTISSAEIWIFVNEDWYREYYDAAAEAKLTQY